jgi:hypothetical protein
MENSLPFVSPLYIANVSTPQLPYPPPADDAIGSSPNAPPPSALSMSPRSISAAISSPTSADQSQSLDGIHIHFHLNHSGSRRVVTRRTMVQLLSGVWAAVDASCPHLSSSLHLAFNNSSITSYRAFRRHLSLTQPGDERVAQMMWSFKRLMESI